MNLSILFDIQAKLDERIVQEHRLQGQDLLDKKILALQVELGELANEQRSWKFWSHDQKPRGQDDYLEYRPVDQGGNHWVNKNPLLEEYVDCLHFILSVGLELEIDAANIKLVSRYYRNITFAFNQIYSDVSVFGSIEDAERNNIFDINSDNVKIAYEEILGGFKRLGELLGFSWEQIEQAYLSKNQINHERQANGY